MPTALPVIRGPSTALYPFTQVYQCQTSCSDSQSGNPSRHVSGFPRLHFEFGYNPLRQADKNALKAAFAGAKGQFTGGSGSAGLTATTDITYTDLGFDSDEFQAVEQVTTQYGVKWSLTQALPQNLSPGTSGGAYPTIATSVISKLPYTQKKRWQTVASTMPTGPKYTFAEFSGGLTNFPTDGLMGWEFDETVLSDALVNTKVAHFLANWGRAFPFTFTDEDGTTYSNVYYASDTMSILRADFGLSRINTVLVQMN